MKTLMASMALLGAVAGTAWAEIGHQALSSQVELVPLDAQVEQSLRNVTYDGTKEVYDHLAADVGGQGPAAVWVSGSNAFSWLFDDVHANTALNPTFSHMHMVLQGTNTGQLGGTSRTQVIGYFGNPGGLDSSHSGPLLTTGGAPAIFQYALPFFTPDFAQAWTLTHPSVVLPAGGDLYAGWLSFDNAAVWGSSASNQSVGTSHVVGSTTTTTTTGGAVNQNVHKGLINGLAAFGTSEAGPTTGLANGFTTTGNLLFSLGFVPEPASIGLLAVGGLLALRRRR